MNGRTGASGGCPTVSITWRNPTPWAIRARYTGQRERPRPGGGGAPPDGAREDAREIGHDGDERVEHPPGEPDEPGGRACQAVGPRRGEALGHGCAEEDNQGGDPAERDHGPHAPG